MKMTTLFFDLDATLYPASSGLWDVIRERIYAFMVEQLGIPDHEVPSLREHYWKTYGTTLEGLRIHHQVESDDYLDFVHNIPLEQYLDTDPALKTLLSSLPQDLWVFTNADHRHASRVLKRLGIEGLFRGVIDLYALDFIVKPNPDAYRTALKLAGVEDGKACLLFDDLLPNLLAARKFGFTTVLVGKNGRAEGVDLQLDSLLEMPSKLPQLWADPLP